MDEVEEKARGSRDFNVAVYDIQKYPRTRIFVLYRAWGERYDFDYAKEKRDHKLERARFAYGGMSFEKPGLTITDACISCGKCTELCYFDAVEEGEPYKING
ncbi:pyridoxine-5-phosphate oxidase, partial [Eubacteriales bacterium DFI.9.88]|nr:pyridoxine-5-phosphate oxidase [Eubacteriales bacterium DFI.9.88]